jgi:hypothetical protein
MNKVVSIVFMLGAAAVAHATTPGFSQGSEFYSSHVQGAVVVTCNRGETATYACNDTVLDPASYDYFVGPEGVNAVEVSLTSTRADGSRRDRTEIYNSKNYRSARPFNLWISTPFQRPFLALGTNRVDYRLMTTKKIVNQGTFSVNVTHGEPRTCPTTHYNSTDSSDCESQYTVCQKYFEQYDYCR